MKEASFWWTESSKTEIRVHDLHRDFSLTQETDPLVLGTAEVDGPIVKYPEKVDTKAADRSDGSEHLHHFGLRNTTIT